MNNAQRLKLSLELAENAKAYCRKVYGENYSQNDLSIIRTAMMYAAEITLEQTQKTVKPLGCGKPNCKKQNHRTEQRGSNVIQMPRRDRHA